MIAVAGPADPATITGSNPSVESRTAVWVVTVWTTSMKTGSRNW